MAAPSANPFGRTSPTCAEHVTSLLGDAVDAVLDGGACEVGVESTIVTFAGGRPLVLRLGGLSIEELEEVLGRAEIAPPTDEVPLAPGRLLRHYAPGTRLHLVEDIASVEPQADRGVLCFRGHPRADGFGAVEVLSERGDVREAATRLFAALRRLDAMELAELYAERVPDIGLGRAINDRLRRAAGNGNDGCL